MEKTLNIDAGEVEIDGLKITGAKRVFRLDPARKTKVRFRNLEVSPDPSWRECLEHFRDERISGFILPVFLPLGA